jgi:hypothetical protein
VELVNQDKAVDLGMCSDIDFMSDSISHLSQYVDPGTTKQNLSDSSQNIEINRRLHSEVHRFMTCLHAYCNWWN